MLEMVEDAIRLTQDNDEAVSFGCGCERNAPLPSSFFLTIHPHGSEPSVAVGPDARVLEACILGVPPLEAVDTAAAELRKPRRDSPQADDRFVATQLEQVSRWSQIGSYDDAMAAYLRDFVAEGETSWRTIA